MLFEPLSRDRNVLGALSENEMVDAVLARRSQKRLHRDAAGDNRCFLDDYLVWRLVGGLPQEPPTFSFEEGMRECTLFYKHRRAEEHDPLPGGVLLDSTRWDEDLIGKSKSELLDTLVALQESIWVHGTIVGRPRTVDDDRALYADLPERIPADFRLPPWEDSEKGIEEQKMGRPAFTCKTFWGSHAGCGSKCNLHQFGPCA